MLTNVFHNLQARSLFLDSHRCNTLTAAFVPYVTLCLLRISRPTNLVHVLQAFKNTPFFHRCNTRLAFWRFCSRECISLVARSMLFLNMPSALAKRRIRQFSITFFKNSAVHIEKKRRGLLLSFPILKSLERICNRANFCLWFSNILASLAMVFRWLAVHRWWTHLFLWLPASAPRRWQLATRPNCRTRQTRIYHAPSSSHHPWGWNHHGGQHMGWG